LWSMYLSIGVIQCAHIPADFMLSKNCKATGSVCDPLSKVIYPDAVISYFLPDYVISSADYYD